VTGLDITAGHGLVNSAKLPCTCTAFSREVALHTSILYPHDHNWVPQNESFRSKQFLELYILTKAAEKFLPSKNFSLNFINSSPI
jgi:hypothetical protein